MDPFDSESELPTYAGYSIWSGEKTRPFTYNSMSIVLINVLHSDRTWMYYFCPPCSKRSIQRTRSSREYSLAGQMVSHWQQDGQRTNRVCNGVHRWYALHPKGRLSEQDQHHWVCSQILLLLLVQLYTSIMVMAMAKGAPPFLITRCMCPIQDLYSHGTSGLLWHQGSDDDASEISQAWELHRASKQLLAISTGPHDVFNGQERVESHPQ